MNNRSSFTAAQFEEGYAARAEISVEEYRKHLTTMPCDCGDEHCKGWAAVNKGREQDQINLYAPFVEGC